MRNDSSRNRAGGNLYATIWRWHFYAGLFVMPFVLLLALTGSFYLFKPQVERYEERAFQGFSLTAAVTPEQQVAAALAADPGASFGNYRLPERAGDAAMITVRGADGKARQIFVAPDGHVAGSLDPAKRLMEVTKTIHAQLLLGPRGSWLVELAACWAIVLVVSGAYLWWPRGRGLAGVLWPRMEARGRLRWRDLHAVTAFWIYGLVAVLLLTSLPWTGVWGGAFQAVRTEFGWVDGPPEWALGGVAPVAATDPHAGHHAEAQMAGMESMANMPGMEGMDGMEGMPGMDGMRDMAGMHGMAGAGLLNSMVAKASAEKLLFPVFVAPPGGMGRFGAPTDDLWTVYSDTQKRPQQVTIQYDATSGAELDRKGYGNGIDKVIGYGIAWHEGQLFGHVNQAIGLLMAMGLITLVVTGFLMWRRRRPVANGGSGAGLGAPPLPGAPPRARGVLAILLVLAALLPLLALSLVALFLFDRLLLPHLPRFGKWLGAA